MSHFCSLPTHLVWEKGEVVSLSPVRKHMLSWPSHHPRRTPVKSLLLLYSWSSYSCSPSTTKSFPRRNRTRGATTREEEGIAPAPPILLELNGNITFRCATTQPSWRRWDNCDSRSSHRSGNSSIRDRNDGCTKVSQSFQSWERVIRNWNCFLISVIDWGFF